MPTITFSEDSIAIDATETAKDLTMDVPKPVRLPIFERFAELKAAHPGVLLIFQNNGFCELFHEDARQASKILGLTVTTWGVNTIRPVPMAGFPSHELEKHLSKLIRSGCRAAICEQVTAYRESAARYAKGQRAIHPLDGKGGYMGRTSRLCCALKMRFSGREAAYICSPAKVRKLKALYAAGWNANSFSYELEPPAALENPAEFLKSIGIRQSVTA